MQNLRIAASFASGPNAMRTQTWIEHTVYAQASIVDMALGIARGPHAPLRLLGARAFENAPLARLLAGPAHAPAVGRTHDRLSLGYL